MKKFLMVLLSIAFVLNQTKNLPNEIREGSGNCGWCGVWPADE